MRVPGEWVVVFLDEVAEGVSEGHWARRALMAAAWAGLAMESRIREFPPPPPPPPAVVEAVGVGLTAGREVAVPVRRVVEVGNDGAGLAWVRAASRRARRVVWWSFIVAV